MRSLSIVTDLPSFFTKRFYLFSIAYEVYDEKKNMKKRLIYTLMKHTLLYVFVKLDKVRIQYECIHLLLQIILVAFVVAILAVASAQDFRHFFAGFSPYSQIAVMRDPRSNRGKLFKKNLRNEIKKVTFLQLQLPQFA